jgi:broad specificity phosphatase PhoE
VEQLFLVRHAETDWNAERRLQGHADRPLSTRGRGQALALGEHLRDTRFEAVFCSDLRRTLDTAALAGFAAGQASHTWREFDVGRWSGLRIESIMAGEGNAYSRWRAGLHTPPGGESWPAFESRIREGLATLESVPGKVLLVTHSGVIRAIMTILLGVPPGSLQAVGHASLSILDFKATPTVASYDARPAEDMIAVLD